MRTSMVLLLAGLLIVPPLSAYATRETCEAGSPTPETHSWNFAEEATDLLRQIETQARQVRVAADEMLMNVNLEEESHEATLTRIRDRVNAMGDDFCRLQQIRKAVEPWQRQAIDHIAPSLIIVANQVQTAFESLDSERGPVEMRSKYVQSLEAVYKRAGLITRSADSFVEYANANLKIEQLEEKLGFGEETAS